jgi:hypothetical protein
MIARPIVDAEIPNIVAQVLHTSRLLILNWKCEPSLQHVHAISVEAERSFRTLSVSTFFFAPSIVPASQALMVYLIPPPTPHAWPAGLIVSRPITPFGLPHWVLFRTGLCLCEREPPNAKRSTGHESTRNLGAGRRASGSRSCCGCRSQAISRAKHGQRGMEVTANDGKSAPRASGIDRRHDGELMYAFPMQVLIITRHLRQALGTKTQPRRLRQRPPGAPHRSPLPADIRQRFGDCPSIACSGRNAQ